MGEGWMEGKDDCSDGWTDGKGAGTVVGKEAGFADGKGDGAEESVGEIDGARVIAPKVVMNTSSAGAVPEK